MAAWVTVGPTGATKVLAYSFLLDETVESFMWACECFKDAFRVVPAVIFTDSDMAMKAAIASAFPGAKHLLCVWHLSKNMFTHIKAACGNNDALWKRMVSAWWLITKQTDASSRAAFDAEWAALAAMLSESTVKGKSMEAARAWLDKMAEERERWAYRWTWRLFTMGIHSTQRIESLHSHIMGYLRASTLLVDLLVKLELHSATVDSRTLTRDYRLIALEESAAKANSHPFIDALKELIHPYPLALVKSQLAQSSYYSVAATAEGIYTVTRISAMAAASETDVVTDGDNADVGLDSSSFCSGSRTCTLAPAGWSCSCQFTSCYGLPCRHILRTCEVMQLSVPVELCSLRWRYRDPAQVREQVEALRRRNPAPRSAPAQTLSRDDRFGLLMSASRVVAELGAVDATLYSLAREGVDALVARLRSGAAPGRRGGGPTSLDVVTERGPEQCRGCWEFGHRKNSSKCSRYGKSPLPKPDDLARAPAVTLMPRRRRGAAQAISSDEEEDLEEEEEEEEEEDSHEDVCHGCSATGELFCCAECRHAYCGDCLPLAAASGIDRDDWRCPICTGRYNGGAVGNPQTGRRQACGKARARKRGPGDPTPSAARAAKRARYADAKKQSGRGPQRFR